jgi:hypothetical protein
MISCTGSQRDRNLILETTDNSETMKPFRSRLFSRIAPTAKDIGLWGMRMQKAFATMGTIGFAETGAAAMLDNDARVADEFDAMTRVRDVAG